MDSLNRVLVVDDSSVTRRFLAKLLVDASYEVVSVSSGPEALELLEQESFDFILTDWMMPEMDGLELCHRVREQNQHRYIYVVMLTAKSQSDDVVKALEAGADDFITKPLEREVLLARLHAGARVLRLERELRKASRRDAPTGVLNRSSLMDIVEQE